MTFEDKKRILDDLRNRWQMTKTECNECIADELIEFGKEIEKDLEVLDIIKEKNVDIESLKYRLRFKDDDVYLHYKYDFIMTREEFDLLKEWLENEKIY